MQLEKRMTEKLMIPLLELPLLPIAHILHISYEITGRDDTRRAAFLCTFAFSTFFPFSLRPI